MTTNVLASGSTEADSSTITVASGATATVAIDCAGVIPNNAVADVFLVTTAGGRRLMKQLTAGESAVVLQPGNYVVTRRATGATFAIEYT